MIKLPGNKVAVTPINDPEQTSGHPNYTAEEIKVFEEMGGFKRGGSGSLIVPDMAKERCDQGIVKYVGPEVKWCKLGMYVLFSGYTGELVHVEGEGRVIIMSEDFIVCELSEPANVDIPGLYFKGKLDKAKQFHELYTLIYNCIDNTFDQYGADEVANIIAKELCRGGVYGPAANPYFQADYEHTLEFISMAFENSEWYKNLKVQVAKPKWNEKNELEPA